MASDPSWWGAMGVDGGSAAGFAGVERRPYTILSQGTSSMAQKVLDDAAALFPEFDGVTNKAVPLPANYASPGFADFVGWHTAHQIQFLKERATNWTPGDTVFVTFGTSPEPIENDTFMLSADGRRVIHINTLQVTDIAQMPLADQERLAALPTFRVLFSNALGWWPADADPNATGPAPPDSSAAARLRLETEVIAPLETIVKDAAVRLGLARDTAVTGGNLETAYPNLFLDQLDIIRTRIENMGVFNPGLIIKMVADLKERFDRIEKYATVTPPSPVADTKLAYAANSTDDLGSVTRALNVFLRAELRLRDIVAQSIDIIFTGRYRNPADPTDQGRVVDTPLMVFLFQTQQNYSAEAEAQAKSEELNEMKALIGIYTKVQKMVNDTLQKFDPVKFQEANKDNDKAVEYHRFYDVEWTTQLPASFTASDFLILSMFDKTLAPRNDNTYLPIEGQTNAGRPLFEFFSMIPAVGTAAQFKLHTQQDWDLFSQSLSKVSKVLSADSQARMDEIDRISRGKNRNYELASDTLNKMTDILRSIIN